MLSWPDLNQMKVIAFSVWGSEPRYGVGMLRNAELAPSIYPGWECWVYYPARQQFGPADAYAGLAAMKHVRLIPVDAPADWRASFWRFAAAAEAGVEVMISRDADSRLNLRERAAVDEWLASDHAFHIMRDHPFHTDPMLAGMWGVRPPRSALARELTARMAAWKQEDYYGTDQAFLQSEVYPHALAGVVIHDAFATGAPALPFPSPRQGLEFVGQQFDAGDWPVFPHSVTLAGALWRQAVSGAARP